MKSNIEANGRTKEIEKEVLALSRPEKIAFYTHFFRADKGDICYGDKLLAIKIPELRKVVSKYYALMDEASIEYFLNSQYNEMRFFGQQVIVSKFKKENLDGKFRWQNFLLKNIESVNHWNLTDSCAPQVFGEFALASGDSSLIKEIFDSGKGVQKGQESQNARVWLIRIAIIATLPLVKKGSLDLAIDMIEASLDKDHEYIQKVNGWVLREIGKKDEKTLITFLKENKERLPSITKSYACEKLRQTYDIKKLLG